MYFTGILLLINVEQIGDNVVFRLLKSKLYVPTCVIDCIIIIFYNVFAIYLDMHEQMSVDVHVIID